MRLLRQLLGYLALAASLVGTSPLLHAQAQTTYKVGDRVEADPMLLGKWRPATVVQIHMASGTVNGYEIQFDAENNRPPEEYTVGTTLARGIRPINGGEKAAPPQADPAQGRVAAAQQTQPTYKVGDRVEADPMLLGKWRPATVVQIHVSSGAVNGYEIQFHAENNRPPEEYTVGTTAARGIRPVTGGGTAAPPQPNPAQGRVAPTVGDRAVAVVAPAQDRAAAAGVCSSEAALTAGPKASDPMELSFERAILGNYQRKLKETSASTPLAVGIAFASFQIGGPRVNQRTLDITDGTYLRSAPVGANIYPVKTNFTECERYRGEITRTGVDGRYECYKDNFGEWACSNASGWRTLNTEREILAPQ